MRRFVGIASLVSCWLCVLLGGTACGSSATPNATGSGGAASGAAAGGSTASAGGSASGGSSSAAGGSSATCNGSTITIDGTGFGNNNHTPEWLGDAIEAGSVGADFSRSDWHNASYGWVPIQYASDTAHSGSQSLKADMTDPSSLWDAEFTYHLPTPIAPGDRLYATWWVKYNGNTNGQWKMLRLSQDDTITDGPHEVTLFHWMESADEIVIDPGTANDQTTWPGNQYFPPPDNQWHRVEIDAIASSAGAHDGSIRLATYANGVVNSTSWDSVETHTSSGDTWSHVIFQNYIGNGITGNVQIWFDDVFIQNSPARVELCGADTWDARSHCEVQPHSAWSDTSIEVTINLGSFAGNDATYLYVIDADGNIVNPMGMAFVGCN